MDYGVDSCGLVLEKVMKIFPYPLSIHMGSQAHSAS
jgi:hypothetical protein